VTRNRQAARRSKRCPVLGLPPNERWRTELDPGRRENVVQRLSYSPQGEKGYGSRATGAERPPDRTKGPCRWKASQDVTSHRLSRVGGQGDLGGFLTRSDGATSSRELERRRQGESHCVVPRRGRGDRGVRGLVGSRRRGKKTPTLVPPPTAHEAACESARQRGSACLAPIRRSVHECRETLGPSVNIARSPRLRASPRGESRVASRERTKYGCT